MNRTRPWQLARRYWFDGLVVVGLAWWVADAVAYRHEPDGAQGPLWFDVLAVLAFTTPFLARRRYPLGSVLAVGTGIALSSFSESIPTSRPPRTTGNPP